MNRESDSETPPDKLGSRIRARIGGLAPSLVRVLEFIDVNRLDAMTKSAAELGAMIGTSDASVIRAVKALGFDGFNDLKRELAATFGHGHSAADNMSRTLTGIGGAHDAAIDRVLEDHGAAFEALTSPATRAQMSAAVKLLTSARRVGVFGLGPSSYLARYFALQLTRSGRPAHVFDGSGSPLPDQLLGMQDVDVVVMLAYGRPYKEATACIAEARRLRKRILLVTDFDEKGLASHATTVVTVHRGQAGRVALHGATFVCLEAITLALASRNKDRSITTLERLNELRKSVGKAP
ncbi:MurR/RpiR family transcriptional regulator [Hyphomicrobium sp.]|uniref:MurR/RpiR family transcriptional regulator n=1 Tax=Hyphomicrobium sp. TaxID=82 RepID=UPI0025BBE4BD|nr:MurR/RpiR family transcriptional regulator [Hyphomicrobium sp.]MCC7250486.1 MurR/RpiR family transcriptional regulator [Hyphomicrobium sp.]